MQLTKQAQTDTNSYSHEFARGMLTKAGTDSSAVISLIKAYALCRYRVSKNWTSKTQVGNSTDFSTLELWQTATDCQ